MTSMMVQGVDVQPTVVQSPRPVAVSVLRIHKGAVAGKNTFSGYKRENGRCSVKRKREEGMRNCIFFDGCCDGQHRMVLGPSREFQRRSGCLLSFGTAGSCLFNVFARFDWWRKESLNKYLRTCLTQKMKNHQLLNSAEQDHCLWSKRRGENDKIMIERWILNLLT